MKSNENKNSSCDTNINDDIGITCEDDNLQNCNCRCLPKLNFNFNLKKPDWVTRMSNYFGTRRSDKIAHVTKMTEVIMSEQVLENDITSVHNLSKVQKNNDISILDRNVEKKEICEQRNLKKIEPNSKTTDLSKHNISCHMKNRLELIRLRQRMYSSDSEISDISVSFIQEIEEVVPLDKTVYIDNSVEYPDLPTDDSIIEDFPTLDIIDPDDKTTNSVVHGDILISNSIVRSDSYNSQDINQIDVEQIDVEQIDVEQIDVEQIDVKYQIVYENLKVIRSIKAGDKLRVSYYGSLSIDDSYLPSFTRKLTGNNKYNTSERVDETIRVAKQLMTRVDKIKNLIDNNLTDGLRNLAKTYQYDHDFSIKLLSLVELL